MTREWVQDEHGVGSWREESPGGSSASQELFASTTVIPTGDTGGPLSWGSPTGDVLISVTDPLAPTIIADGTYAISARAVGQDNAAGTLLLQLQSGATVDMEGTTDLNTDGGTVGAPKLSLSATFKASADDSLTLYCQQDSGSDMNVSANVIVVKL